MSIDAAQKKTYEALRRGGHWKDLLIALSFVKDLREANILDFLQFNFVVTADNFRDMPNFVTLCEDHAADKIHFTMVIQHQHMTDEFFNKINLRPSTHILTQEFAEVLAHPNLKRPSVDTSCLPKLTPPPYI